LISINAREECIKQVEEYSEGKLKDVIEKEEK
jgi:hypothetical protein